MPTAICGIYIYVTPFMGVWIEIAGLVLFLLHQQVTPFMGVWIEIGKPIDLRQQARQSHPLWVCGLKLVLDDLGVQTENVTPFMGVWIEIQKIELQKKIVASHPLWVCGLKLVDQGIDLILQRHTLYGCVD